MKEDFLAQLSQDGMIARLKVSLQHMWLSWRMDADGLARSHLMDFMMLLKVDIAKLGLEGYLCVCFPLPL